MEGEEEYRLSLWLLELKFLIIGLKFLILFLYLDKTITQWKRRAPLFAAMVGEEEDILSSWQLELKLLIIGLTFLILFLYLDKTITQWKRRAPLFAAMEGEEEEDRLSSLPDSLIIEIISRLSDTKEAVRTGILSKQWKHLWTQVPNLVFYHYKRNENKDSQSLIDFFSYLEKTITQCSHLNLAKFQLITKYDDKFKSHVNNSIRHAINCNVQQFYLWLSRANDEEWCALFEIDSESFFNNSCFTHLHVSNCMFNPSGTISWKNLRSLRIERGKLDEGLIQNILSGSPLLETIIIQHCRGLKRIDITSNSVKTLVFSGPFFVHDFIDSGIEINAPHILTLYIIERLEVDKLKLLNVSSLVKAELDYKIGWSPREEEEDMLATFTQSLRHVK